jgi:peptide/nickel transport system substrate-binding protein
MKKLRWQLIIIFLTGLVVGVLLISEQPGAKLQPFVTAAPEKGGIYTEALVGSLQRLNPLFDYYNSADRDVDRLLFSGLLRFDARGLPQPDLAEKWGVSEDGLIYNVNLRKDAKWHDGQPVTADDVIFTIELMRKGGKYIPDDVQKFWQNVQVRGKGQLLQFKLPEPYTPFLDYLTFGILPKHLLGALPVDQVVNSPFNLQPVGTGPFKFDHMIVEDNQATGVALKSFDGYFGQKPYLEDVIFRYYPDSAAALKAYQEQQVQGISQITTDVLPKALAEPNLSIQTARKPELAMVLFNLKNEGASFLQDAKVRQALLTGLNRQWMIDHVLKGQAIVADGPIFPGTWAYYDGVPRTEFDPEAAKAMLKDAGYTLAENATVRSKDKADMKMKLLYPDNPSHKILAEGIQKYWGDLGVQVDLEAAPYDEIINKRLQDRDYEAALVDLNFSRSPDPDPYPFWDSVQAQNGQNYSQWNDKIASEYLEQARVTNDFDERTRLYKNFQVIFADQLPALPLFYPVYNYGVDRQVLGVRMGPLLDTSDRFATITDWHLKSRPVTASVKTPSSGQ